MTWSAVAPVASGRTWLAAALGRLRSSWRRILEATVAATVAWLLDVRLLGHPAPFFAPAAALIALGVTRGQRFRRAAEIVVGVALGVLVSDLIARGLGPRTGWSIMAVTLFTISAAIFVGGGPILVVQSAVSAIYVAVVTPPGSGLVPSRFVDALVGGAVALVVNQLPLHGDPFVDLDRATRRVVDELVDVLDDIAAALRRHDTPAARAALARARTSDPIVRALGDGVGIAREGLRFDPLRRRRAPALEAYAQAAVHLDHAVRNARVLARAAVALTRRSTPAPDSVARALGQLGVAAATLARELSVIAAQARARPARSGGWRRSRPLAAAPVDLAPQVAEDALGAVRLAAEALRMPRPDLQVTMLVGAVRSAAVDLLLGSGSDLSHALSATDAAMGLESPDDAESPESDPA